MPDLLALFLLTTQYMKPCYNHLSYRTAVFWSLSNVNLAMIVTKYEDPTMSKIQYFSLVIHLRKFQKETLNP